MDVNPSETGWSWTDDNFAMGWAALDTSPRDWLVYFETPKWLGSSRLEIPLLRSSTANGLAKLDWESGYPSSHHFSDGIVRSV